MNHSDEQLNTEIVVPGPGQGSIEGDAEPGSAWASHRGLRLVHSRLKWNDTRAEWRSGEFFKLLPMDAVHEFERNAVPYPCAAASILLNEEEQPDTVLFLLEGSVKLSVGSIDGRHLTVGVARPGDVLGLAAIVSGLPHETTAVTQVPCQLTSLPRRDFLAFLMRYPIAAQNAGLQLSREYTWACEQSCSPGIKLTSGTRLARLLLKWCASGDETDHGIRIECSLTNEEIGGCIGMSSESVSRIIRDLVFRELVVQHGCALVIPSVRALEIYANRNDD